MESISSAHHFPERWDTRWIEQRWQIELEKFGRHQLEQGTSVVRQPFIYRFLKWGLKTFGLYNRGYRNYLDLQVRQVEHAIPEWPEALHGLRILQISDLHIDLDPGILPVLCKKLKETQADMTVLTGDFWEGHRKSVETAREALTKIRESLGNPSLGLYGVLGNHDSLIIAEVVENLGIRLLNNESVVIGEGLARFALSGVDDAYMFKMDDLPKAASQCPDALPRILLSHSPQISHAASVAGYLLMLSGHTHGGQICIPGGYCPISMVEVPSPVFKGSWCHGKLFGYTSLGCGCSHVPVRFNCPPEIVVHHIHRAV